MTEPPSTAYRFAGFVLSPARRALAKDGRDVPLIPRYFDLLVLLVSERHRAVHRQEIFDRVWADVVVSDGALTQAIRTIRRVLDDDPREVRFIRTVSRHGYQFVWGEVTVEAVETVKPVTAVKDEGPRAQELGQAQPDEDDRFEPLLAVLTGSTHTDEERYDAAVRLHELSTDEALRRLDERPGHAEARAILRDARWDAPSAGPVPLLSTEARARAITDVIALRLNHAASLASARWASAAGATALAGVVAGAAGGMALSFVPESTTGVDLVVTLGILGGLAGAAGGAGVGAGLAAAEAVARSARAVALIGGGAIAGALSGALANLVVRSVVSAIFGHAVDALPGAFEGLVIGAAVGAGYALATRRLPQGGMAAPRGGERWRASLTTGVVSAIAAIALSLAGRHLVGSSLDVMADAFAGSEVGLDAFARLLGEDSLRPITRTIVSAFEALVFGAGLAFGLTRRPVRTNHRDTEHTEAAQRVG
jgi:DNA-binding winged helix-turn-helix (wHTH) protein